MFKTLVVSASILCLTIATASARVDPLFSPQADIVAVAYGDIDLEQADGRAALMDRIQRASQRLCRFEGSRAERAACVRRSVAFAVGNAPEPVRLALRDQPVLIAEARVAPR
jgi:UrcA family protein